MGLTRPRAHQLQDSDFKQSVRAISTTNVTLSGGAPSTVDGVSLSLGDRVLVTGQSTASQNGIYVVTTVGAGSDGTWERSPDADTTGDMTAGMVVMVTEGTSYADTSWKITTNDPITLDTTGITFEQSSAYGYGTIAVAGQSSIVADSVGDTLTVTNGDNITVTTDAGTDTLTISVSGTVPSANTAGTVTTAAQPNITSVGNLNGINVSGNILPTANITYNLGSDTARWNELFLAGSTINLGTIQLKDNGGSFEVFQSDGTTPAQVQGNIAAANVVGTVSSATIAATVTTAAQPNITSVGTLTSLTVTGNVDSGNVSGTTGAFTSVTGNGRALTSLSASNLDAGTLPSARLSGSYSISVDSATSATTAGTVTTAAQPNITSVGTLSSLSVTGNVSSGNVSGTTGAFTSVTGNGRSLTSLDASNLDTGTVPSARLSGSYSISVTSATTAGTVTTAAQPNITSVGTLSSLSVTGNISSGNLSGTLVSGTLSTAAQPNITSVGTLTSLTTSGNVEIQAQNQLRFFDTDSSHYVALRSAGTVSANVTWTLPSSDGTDGQVLSTNGGGTLSWADAGTGGGSSGSSYPNSTISTLPGKDGNYDLSKTPAQTTSETPFESGVTDPFGVNLGSVFSMMDPIGSIQTSVEGEGGLDLGVLT